MARRKSGAGDTTDQVTGFRYDAPRKNNPSAGLAAQARVREAPKVHYSYDPHLPPELRFDSTGASDELPQLLEDATQRTLTPAEARTIAAALRQHQPWLEWTAKQESRGFVVDPVALHIHERVSAQAILKMAKREDVQRDLFADPQQPYREAVQFYQHDVDWANRLILGDSLQVMASLVKREDLAGKVQMIYLDPPYGIRFASNFQNEIGKRDVTDKESDLTREPEMIKAYRDTWTLGVHSYLAYLRDRLMLCRELLTDSGSIFVQISDENLHRVRATMDDVFGVDNAVVTIVLKKKGATTPVDPVNDYILWYARNRMELRVTRLYEKRRTPDADSKFNTLLTPAGELRRVARMSAEQIEASTRNGWTWCRVNYPVVSQHYHKTRSEDYPFHGVKKTCGTNRQWSFDLPRGMDRLAASERLFDSGGDSLGGIVRWKDWEYAAISNLWGDLKGEESPSYVVQTAWRAIERCLLMTTAPGDLVVDPTCGSGTTAYVAERCGRRWITIDSSRVALAIARQRLLTSKFEQYRVRPPKADNGRAHKEGDPANGFVYETAPHITLKSIAKNTGLDPIFARHESIVASKLGKLNAALKKVSSDVRRRLSAKLAEKEKREGKRSITDADRRRWLLPTSDWKEWEVPFDTDPDWPAGLQSALVDYRAAWRAKMDEVDAAIAANAEPEELVDHPEIVPGIVRVSGPFTVEAVMPAEESMDDSPIESVDGDLETFGPSSTAADAINAEPYLDRMRRLLLADGVRFLGNKVAKISRLDPMDEGYLHAEGDWNAENGKPRRLAVSFGPQHGPVTAVQVEQALHAASRGGFDDVIFAGFNFDGAAQGAIQDDVNPRVRAHLVHIRPDVQMDGLLKNTPSSQLFTVFGNPRTTLNCHRDGTLTVTMEGVDVYDPVENTIVPTKAEKVAAWFVDTDYDGRTFCITQAFFPDKSAWDKLARALKNYWDEDKFAALSGTTSLPFEAGTHHRCAVKVIDPRGNEVMRVHRLEVPVATGRASRRR